MCGPLATFAISAVSSVVGFAGEQQDYESKSAQWKQNYVNALAAGRDEQNQINQKQMQEGDALDQKQHLSMLEAAQAEGQAKVAAQADGVAGQGVNLMIRDVQGKAAYNQTVNEQNYMNVAQQLTSERQSAQKRIQDRINSVARPSSPSAMNAILGVAGAGVKYATATGAM